MLGTASSAGVTLSDTVIGLIYLAAVVTAVLLATRRIVTNRRQQPPEPPPDPATQAWTRVLAPMAIPSWTAPKRTRTAPERERVHETRAGADGATADTASASLIDLRDTPTAPGKEPSGGRVNADEVAEPIGRGATVLKSSARLLSPPRPTLAQPFVAVLGQLELGCAIQPDRKVVKELAFYLALHRERPTKPEELLDILWPTRDWDFSRERDLDPVHQAASRLRRCIGPEALPDATVTDGYLLSDVVTCDWDLFRALVVDASKGADPITKLCEALSLVSGPPFSGLKEDSYTWVGSELLVSHMTSTIVHAAHDLVELARSANDDATAEWGACQGLLASPPEEMLHEDRLHIAAAVGDAARFERIWKEALVVLGKQAEDGPVGATYWRLRQQLRGSSD